MLRMTPAKVFMTNLIPVHCHIFRRSRAPRADYVISAAIFPRIAPGPVLGPTGRCIHRRKDIG